MPFARLEAHHRIRLGKMVHPVRGLLNGAAAVGFLVAGALLVWLSPGDMARRMSLAAFALRLIALYTVSALYHSVPWSERWKLRMRRLDHSMIYVLIAGTYTPIAFIALDGWLRWATLAVQWSIALAGIAHKTLRRRPHNAFSIPLQVVQGWLAVLLILPLAQVLPPGAIALMGVGGLLYTVGMVFVVTGWPRLWPRAFSYHELFHVFVVAASAAHFAVVFGWVAPLGQ